jgi:hypothetical protein
MNANGGGRANFRAPSEKRQIERPRGGDDQRVERIASEAQLIGQIDLL